jgi:hypothetical protein
VRLNEIAAVDARSQFAQAHAHQRVAASSDDADVLIGGLEANHVGHRNHADAMTHSGADQLDPLSRLIGRNSDRLHTVQLRGGLAGAGCSATGSQTLAQARDGFLPDVRASLA